MSSITFQVIPVIEPGQTLLITVPVGNLPMASAKRYLESVKEHLQSLETLKHATIVVIAAPSV